MNEQVLTEYVKYLLDQRSQLEVSIFQLRKELDDLRKPKQEANDTPQG